MIYTFIEKVIVIYGLCNFRIHGLSVKSLKDISHQWVKKFINCFYFEQAIGKLLFKNRTFLQVTQLKYVNGQGFTGVQVKLHLIFISL